MKKREEIVRDAFAKLGIPGEGDSLTPEQRTAGNSALSSMTKTFHNKHGMPMWKTKNYTFPLASMAAGVGIVGKDQVLPTTTRPYRVVNAWRVHNPDNQRVPMTKRTLEEFTNTPNPLLEGQPIEYLTSVYKDTIEVTLWPLPEEYWRLNGSIVLTVVEQIADTSDDNATPDFPDDWEEALIYGLAKRLGPEYGVPQESMALIVQGAKEFLEDALESGNEYGSIFIKPAVQYG